MEKAIEEGRSYKGQSQIFADLLEDRSTMMKELESQQKMIELLTAENAKLQSFIEENRTATTNKEQTKKYEGGVWCILTYLLAFTI